MSSLSITQYRPVSLQHLPEEILTSVFSYLTGSEEAAISNSEADQVILSTKAVCRSWRDGLYLNQERQKATSRLQLKAVFIEMRELHNYPRKLVQLLQGFNLPIFQLPTLDFTNRPDGDYIANLKPKDMTHPIMKFKDNRGRVGMAFHLEGRSEKTVKVWRKSTQVKDLSDVLSVFQRDAAQTSRWVVGIGGLLGVVLKNLHSDKHGEEDHIGPEGHECENCLSGMRSGDDMDYKTLSMFLSGGSPFARIGQDYHPYQKYPAVEASAPVNALPVDENVVVLNI